MRSQAEARQDPTPTLTLYGHAWCHLCQDMRDALLSLQAELGFDVEYVEIEALPELEARFGELVPVLVAGEGELCHYFLDHRAVRDHFLKIR